LHLSVLIRMFVNEVRVVVCVCEGEGVFVSFVNEVRVVVCVWG